MLRRMVSAAVAIGVIGALSVSSGTRVSAAGKPSEASISPAGRAAVPSQPMAVLAAANPHATMPATTSAVGVPAYAPVGSRAEVEIIDAARLLGIPTVRTPRFPTTSPAAFFSLAALSDPRFPRRLREYVGGGRRALITSNLANRLGRLPSQYADRVFVLPTRGGVRGVLSLPQAQVDRLRNFVLHPLGLRMEAPPRVCLLLMDRDTLVLENHNSFAAGVKLTFLPPRWAAARALKGDGAEVPLLGSTVALQAPPKATQRFQIVSRE